MFELELKFEFKCCLATTLEKNISNVPGVENHNQSLNLRRKIL